MPERLGDSCGFGLALGTGRPMHSAFGIVRDVSLSLIQPVWKKSVIPFSRTCQKGEKFFFPLFLFLFSYFISKLQLLAAQNLKFIDPFCKIAAKTKE